MAMLMPGFRRTVVLVLAWALMPASSMASQLDDAMKAGEKGVSYLEGALTGIYQEALEADENTGNYEIDLIGSILLKSGDENRIGNTDLVFWAFSVNNLGSLQSTGQMQQKAGLLWATNDINVDSSVTQFGVLGIRQFFYGNRLELGFGKMFPGMIHTESSYTANNSETFMSKIVAASAVGSYFEAIGLGANLRYWGKEWFVQGGFSDAKAESEIDFDSLFDGVWAWTAEAGWMPRSMGGSTSVSFLAFHTDRTSTLTSQNGWAFAATHDFGQDDRYGVFGRYTRADGAEGISEADRSGALPLASAAFVGVALNRPLGRPGDQLGLVALYGKPTSYQRQQGFDDQYGFETFWKFAIGDFFRITPSVQVLRNMNDDAEFVVGIRAKVSNDFAKYFGKR